MIIKTHLTKLIVATFCLALAFFSCKKDETKEETSTTATPYSCATCVTAPEALAQHDNTSKGIYKGVLIGSTGTVKFDIQNGSNDITATMVIDGDTILLTSSVTVEEGQTLIAPFTGTWNGEAVSLVFQVDADGNNSTILTANIPGHSGIVVTVVKETSTDLVEAFEGTYNRSASETGTFNIVLSRSMGLWGGIAREDGELDHSEIDGTITANGTIKNEDGVNIGQLNGETLSGSFQDSEQFTVTFSGQRTL